MDPASSMQIAALVVLVLLSAFFSGTETAFTSFNRNRARRARKRRLLCPSGSVAKKFQ